MLSHNLFLIAKKSTECGTLLLRKMCVVCIMNKTQKVKIPEIGNSSVHYSGWEVWSGNFDSQKWERGKEALGMELTWAIRVGQVPAQNVERGHGDAHRSISDGFHGISPTIGMPLKNPRVAPCGNRERLLAAADVISRFKYHHHPDSITNMTCIRSLLCPLQASLVLKHRLYSIIVTNIEIEISLPF